MSMRTRKRRCDRCNVAGWCFQIPAGNAFLKLCPPCTAILEAQPQMFKRLAWEYLHIEPEINKRTLDEWLAPVAERQTQRA